MLRTTPVVVRSDSTITSIFVATSYDRPEWVLSHACLDSAIHAVRKGMGLLQTAAGPGNSARLVRAFLTKYGRSIANEYPVRLGTPVSSPLQLEHTIVEAPLASLPPLVVAAGFGSLDVVRCLVEEFNFDPARPARSGLTPLVAAMQHRRFSVIEYLVPLVSVSEELATVTCMPTTSAIAMAAWLLDPRLIDVIGGTPTEWNAYYTVDDQSLGTGIQAPECATPLVIALYRGRETKTDDLVLADVIRAMIRRGADLSAVGRYARRLPHSHLSTALQCAIDFSFPQCVRVLLLAGVSPSASLGGVYNMDCNPLKRAVKANNIEIVKLLLVAGGQWGPEMYSTWRFSQTQSTPEMRAFVTTAMKLLPGQKLLNLCSPDPAMLRLAMKAESRSLISLHSLSAYSPSTLLTWFTWTPSSHQLFPARQKRSIEAAIRSFHCAHSRSKVTRASKIWKTLPPELFRLVLSFLDRVATF